MSSTDIESFRDRISPVVSVVAKHYRVTQEQLYEKGRTKTVELARAASMWLVRNIYNYSFPEIGKAFDRDHTTVMHSCRAVDIRIGTNAEYRDTINGLRHRILSVPGTESVFKSGVTFPKAVWKELRLMRDSGMLGETVEDVIISLVSSRIYELRGRKYETVVQQHIHETSPTDE